MINLKTSIFLLILLSCNNFTSDKITSNKNELNEKFLVQNESDCLVDTNVNSYALEKDLTQLIGDIDNGNSDPNFNYILYNNDLTEKLIFFFYPGRIKNHCSYFVVEGINISDSTVKIVDCEHFISGNGIKLGSDIEEVKSKLNMNFVKTSLNNDTIVFDYLVKLNNEDCINVSSKYNFPYYSAKYVFIRNIIVEFRFGFVYP
nr:hypothetical protein [Bacteroidota bacterium]